MINVKWFTVNAKKKFNFTSLAFSDNLAAFAETDMADDTLLSVRVASREQPPHVHTCAYHACLALCTVLTALLPLALPLAAAALLAPPGLALALPLALLLSAALALGLCLAVNTGPTSRWLYAWFVGYWVGFRGISHLLSCLALPSIPFTGWLTYRHTVWYANGKGVTGCAALTIDDCPGDNPVKFAELLDVLKSHGVRATLFVISERVTPEMAALLRRAVTTDGHELGNHMPTDRSYWRDDTPTFLTALRQAKAVLAEISEDAPPWFRAPKGQLSDAMMPALAAENYRHVLGDVHSNDHEFRWSAPGQRLTDYHVDYNVR